MVMESTKGPVAERVGAVPGAELAGQGHESPDAAVLIHEADVVVRAAIDTMVKDGRTWHLINGSWCMGPVVEKP